MSNPEALHRCAAVSLALALAATATPGRAAEAPAPDDHGRSVYAVRCAPCHGDGGAGDGPAAAALEPKPRNFRDPAFWSGRSPVQLKLVVEHGRPGTMMAPFQGVLSDEEIDAVVAYLVAQFKPPRR
jgi:mono/diheme cytochrome c family protein